MDKKGSRVNRVRADRQKKRKFRGNQTTAETDSIFKSTSAKKLRIVQDDRVQDQVYKVLAVAKRNRYTIEEKKNILDECKTLNSRELCVKYGLNKSVLSRWRSNEETIKNAAKTSCTKTLKKVSETNELDAELFKWLSDCRCKGISVSGPMQCRQALVINSRIGGPENFKASPGWLEKWKRRTYIENLKTTEAKMAFKIHVDSPKVKYTNDHIEAEYDYQTTTILKDEHSNYKVTPLSKKLHIRTQVKVPKLGVMLVGWGGNNGTTITAALLANKMKLSWETKDGLKHANWYGSLTQASTIKLGSCNGEDTYVPLCWMLPMVRPDDIEVDGWDISDMNLANAMARAKVLDINLQKQLAPHMARMKPRKSLYYPDFIAANQKERANNLILGSKLEQLERIRKDIADMKASKNVDRVIVLWTANTERFADIIPGVNDTAENLLKAIDKNHPEISPSTMFAVASALEGCTYINGSPQNTFVPGAIELAEKHKTFIAGDDFKSGQTKLKSVLVDFLVSAGIKPVAIVSYNHLGNNDGYNLSAPLQFRSKEISKSNVVDDMVASNDVLYNDGEKPDHCVVIKYVPYVGDSKRAMDEYTSEIMLGGHNTIVVHNTCEDSLLASPIILDLVILAELCSRITFNDPESHEDGEYVGFHSVLSILSYLCKAPLVPEGAPIINALSKQRAAIENVLRACLSLPPENHMLLEHRMNLQKRL